MPNAPFESPYRGQRFVRRITDVIVHDIPGSSRSRLSQRVLVGSIQTKLCDRRIETHLRLSASRRRDIMQT
ncbi:hypothetical protein D3C76_1503730 [compost metagenome]